MKAALLARLCDAREAARPVVLATRLRDGAQWLLPGDAGPPEVAASAEAALRSGNSKQVEIAGEQWFLHVHAPAPRLILIGAVHIAQSLASMAQIAGWRVTIADPRRGFATEPRFPGIGLHHAWPDDALRALAPDQSTAIVTLTHDPKLDDPALLVALRSPAFYVGALGSRRTHEQRVGRLLQAGLSADELGRLRAPVGLKLNAVSAPEIAVSILAEIIAVRRGGDSARR